MVSPMLPGTAAIRALPYWWARVALSLALLLSITACQQSPAAALPAHAPLPTVTGLAAVLEDEVRELPGARLAWSTYWKVCWADYPGAVRYELQAVTGEGARPKPTSHPARCFRLQAAAGENRQAQGLLNREFQLALQRGQLSYRVRAVLPDGRQSAWSAALAVGQELPPAKNL